MKDRMTLEKRGTADRREILAPAVGRYCAPPSGNSFLSPGSEAGLLRVLNRTYRLVVPAGVSGVVREVFVSGLHENVEYGQPLFRLGRGLDTEDLEEGTRAGEGIAGEEEVPEGMLAVRSPTDGIFYRRPGPDQPAYVAEGDEVARGKVLGLVEVMKCFTQIAYGAGAEAPERAVVRKVVSEDSAEVKLNGVLFLLEPIG